MKGSVVLRGKNQKGRQTSVESTQVKLVRDWQWAARHRRELVYPWLSCQHITFGDISKTHICRAQRWQNCRITEAGRDLWRSSSPSPLPTHSQLEQLFCLDFLQGKNLLQAMHFPQFLATVSSRKKISVLVEFAAPKTSWVVLHCNIYRNPFLPSVEIASEDSYRE